MKFPIGPLVACIVCGCAGSAAAPAANGGASGNTSGSGGSSGASAGSGGGSAGSGGAIAGSGGSAGVDASQAGGAGGVSAGGSAGASGASGGAGLDASAPPIAEAGKDASDASTPVPSGQLVPRVVAYVNCLCGFGAGDGAGACLGVPDPNVNHIKTWEDTGTSPITHYVISFLSFKGTEIQTDPGAIWANGGGSTSDFALQAGLKDALRSAQAQKKRIYLSLGGEIGSSGFLAWWSASGAAAGDARVQGMRAKLTSVAEKFAQQNGLVVDGFDVDIELGGAYQATSDKYIATRDLINAVPDSYQVAFVPQVGNGLCAAPVVGDPLSPTTALGGQCQQPVNGDDSPWVLARLDKDCKKGDGSPKLEYFGIQYYNAGTAECCGGGSDSASMIRSTMQNYKNLANGWPASGDTTSPSNPWYQWAWYPGPWAAFGGIGADRLVLGKPGCQGCAGSNYLDLASMKLLIGQLDGRLAKPMGGILFWDLCRLFGNVGPQCVSGECQPSWGAAGTLQNLTDLRTQMAALRKQ